MTRNNLDVHLSWLFANKNTPPVGVQRALPTPAVVNLEELGLREEDFEDGFSSPVQSPVRSPIQKIPTSRPVQSDYTRPPAPPPPNSNAISQNHSRFSGVEAMGKYDSERKPAVSGVMSQRQLATPASTTASVAPTGSTLTKGYAEFLRENQGETPTARSVSRRLQSDMARSHTPQTPRQTPRLTTEYMLRNIESVDLTGDNSGGEVSRSSSTEIVFGSSNVVWTPGAAARPEPRSEARSSKKRKSEDMPKSSVKKRPIGSPSKRRMEDISLEGFMDIDEVVSRPGRSTPRPTTTKPIIEKAIPENDMEEYQVTETISRTETRTRKSISRVPSVTEVMPGPGRRGLATTEQLSAPQKRSIPSSPAHTRPKIQVARSPSRKPPSPNFVEHSPSPQKAPKRQPQRVIQDSDEDDDEMLLDDLEFSPPAMVKNSPQVTKRSRSPKWQGIPEFESKPLKANDHKDQIPRIGSPLRPLSKNTVDRIPSPFRPPTIISSMTKPFIEEHGTPSSTFTGDDKTLASRYLSDPTSIDSYAMRVKNHKDQNGADCMEYADKGLTAPQYMRDERVRLLDMEKAYNALKTLSDEYQELKKKKKNLARQISDLLDLDVDTSRQEEAQSSLTREMRECEKEVAKLLHSSGAIKDGFGTGSVESDQRPPISSSRIVESRQTSGSSVAGSAQIILQTQFPTLHKSTPSSYHGFQDSLPLRPSPSPRRDLAAEGTSNRYQSSPSPIRRSAHPVVTAPPYQPLIRTREIDSPHRRVQQQNSMRELSSYGAENEDDFNDFDMNEAENEGNSFAAETVPDEVEDEYGDSDEDGFLEVAQEFENQPSLPVSRRTSISNPSVNTLGVRKTQKTSTKDMYSNVESSHAKNQNHPWSKDVKKALRERFKLQGFRQNQLDAINATLSGKDVFVLMPTGGGKSLCYQLPAIVQSGKTRGVTVVISPLLSLMSDQVDHLKKRNIQAFLINGEKAKEERDLVFKALKEPLADQYIQILYITPEMIGKSQALLNALGQLHRNKRLARIVIDEAHCVSQWGHDFRPDYKTLSKVRKDFPGVPFIALTATATENVKADCIHNLGMEGCKEYKQSFNRPNLHYEILPKKGAGSNAATIENMIELIKSKYKGQTGIVYTLSRANCEDLADKLRKGGIKAHHFHAAMQPEEKTQVQRDWQAGKWKVVVATIAFGMGIDKADVRFVIHHTMPKSLEGYYQETGRAGRDGKQSSCYLYYGFQDTAVLRRFIDDSEGDEQVKEQQRQMLNRMVQFCENRIDCRRSEILAYFGESFSKEDCNNSCDNCNSDAVYETVDMTDLAKSALRVIRAVQATNVTLLYVVDVLRGSKAAKIAPAHQELEGHGSSKALPRGEVERLLIRLLTENAIVENNVFNKGGFATPYLRCGPSAQEFLSGRRKLKVPMKVARSPVTGAQPVIKKKPAAPTSTLFTSPVSPSRKNKGKGHATMVHEVESDYGTDGFLEDESDDAFEPVKNPPPHRTRQRAELGPPITSDDRMNEINDVHRDVVQNFVKEAQKIEEKLITKLNLSRRIFSEINFREMAINWTLSLDDMNDIADIDRDKVRRYGLKFLPLIQQFYEDYEQMMGHNLDRDMDPNHQVIDLCDDDDEEDEEEEDYGDGSEDDEENQTPGQSRYFASAAVERFNQEVIAAQQLPQTRHERPEVPKKATGFKRKGGGRSRGGKRNFSGRSNGSSAAGSSRPKAYAASGVAKKASTARKTSYAKKPAAGASSSKGPPYFDRFRNSGGGSGAGSSAGGGIMSMPM